MKRCVIIAGGEISDYASIRTLISDGDFILCADHGYDHAVNLGVSADLVVGDMDSVGAEPPSDKRIVFPCNKDATDTELAVSKAISLGFDEYLLLGCTGARGDHAIANIFLLTVFLRERKSAYIADERSFYYIIDRELVLSGAPNTIFSLLPLSERATGVTLSGAKYPLLNAAIPFGSTIGISNEFLNTRVTVSLESGLLLVILGRNP